MNFKDYFSDASHNYKNFRPSYPDALFEYVASLTKERKLAWDCATGNGQAAVKLADYFNHLIASDASAEQIKNAKKKQNISYQVFPAEKTPLNTGSIDLITVAQALHWFNHADFFREADRVLKPGGILVVWAYGLNTINEEIDKITNYLYEELLGDYWPSERIHIENGYKNIEFPYPLLTSPEFFITEQRNLTEYLGYLNTWSSVKLYEKANGNNPVELIFKKILSAWGNPEESKTVRYPITLKAGRRG